MHPHRQGKTSPPLENCSQRNTDAAFGQDQESPLLPVIDRWTDKVELRSRKVLCKGLKGAEEAHGTSRGNEGTHQFLTGKRSGEDPDALFAMLVRQMLAHKEELLVKHQIKGGNHFFGLEEGIADLLVQLGIVFIAQKFCTAL